MTKRTSVLLIILTLMMSLSLTSCKKDPMLNKYQNLKDENHIFEVVDEYKIIELLNSRKKAIIVFSFPECPWCQAAIPYINEIAKEEGIDKVYYLNILKIREEQTNEYLQIFEHIRYDIGNPEKINAPTVIVINNGNVLGYHIDTVESHVKTESGVLLPMNQEQIDELKDIYRKLFKLN